MTRELKNMPSRQSCGIVIGVSSGYFALAYQDTNNENTIVTSRDLCFNKSDDLQYIVSVLISLYQM